MPKNSRARKGGNSKQRRPLKTKKKHTRHCGICGSTEHNRRKCPVTSIVFRPIPKQAKKEEEIPDLEDLPVVESTSISDANTEIENDDEELDNTQKYHMLEATQPYTDARVYAVEEDQVKDIVDGVILNDMFDAEKHAMLEEVDDADPDPVLYDVDTANNEMEEEWMIKQNASIMKKRKRPGGFDGSPINSGGIAPIKLHKADASEEPNDDNTSKLESPPDSEEDTTGSPPSPPSGFFVENFKFAKNGKLETSDQRDISAPNQDKLKMKTVNTYFIDVKNGTKTVVDSRLSSEVTIQEKQSGKSSTNSTSQKR